MRRQIHLAQKQINIWKLLIKKKNILTIQLNFNVQGDLIGETIYLTRTQIINNHNIYPSAQRTLALNYCDERIRTTPTLLATLEICTT